MRPMSSNTIIDDEDDGPPRLAGGKFYMTPTGHAALSAELHTLRAVERPRIVDIVSWAAGNGDRSENGDYLYGKRRLREIDGRMRFLMRRLKHAEVIDPALQANRGQVFFGATVTYLVAATPTGLTPPADLGVPAGWSVTYPNGTNGQPTGGVVITQVS